MAAHYPKYTVTLSISIQIHDSQLQHLLLSTNSCTLILLDYIDCDFGTYVYEAIFIYTFEGGTLVSFEHSINFTRVQDVHQQR